AKVVPSLVCSDTESFPGSYKEETGNDATLVFSGLSINDLKNRSCKKVVLMVDHKSSFAGDVDVAFAVPAKEETLKFPVKTDGQTSAMRYILKYVDVSGDLGVETTPGGVCLV